MRKKIFTLLLLFVGIIGAYADNTLAVSSAIVTQGQECEFDIQLINSDELTAMQFDLTLPEGITVKEVEGSNRLHKTHSIGKSTVGGKTIVTLFSGENELITGESGTTIFTIVVTVDKSVTVGDKVGTISNMELTKKDETKSNPKAVDFTITVTDYITLDENSTVDPEAKEGVNVLVKRTISANNWNTICLPFAMTDEQVKSAFGNDVKLADFNGYEATEDDGNIVGIAVKFNSVTNIEANHPYIIKVTSAISEFTVDGVDIAPEEEPTKAAVKRTKKEWSEMIGTYAAKTIDPDGGSLLFLSGNKFYYFKEEKAFKGYRGYFDFYDVLSEVENAEARMTIVLDEKPTSIEGMTIATEDGEYYNLNGMKVVNPTEKGVYIKNGKKVVIK